MKYGYVYVGVSVAIVVIGIFLIYELGLKQDTLQDKDELQHLQTTEMNDIYKPTMTEDQAIQIVKSDLSKHFPNIDQIVIIGKDTLPFDPTYAKFPQRLIFVLPNGTQLFINQTDYSARVMCVPETSYGFCPSQGKVELQATTGKLFYIIEPWWTYKTREHFDSFTFYFIDANNGDILYSNLLESIPSDDVSTQYRP